MKIQSRIILTIVSFQLILLISFGGTIYYLLNNYVNKSFRVDLKHRANINEKIVLEKNLISKEEYNEILKEYVEKLTDEKRYHIPYPYKSDSLISGKNSVLPKEFITNLLQQKSYFYSDDSIKFYGEEFIVDGSRWLIIISANDLSGDNLLSELKNIIIIGTIIISIILFIVSYILSRSILKPIKNKVYSAMKISSSNMHERIDVENPNDELGQLAIAFNRMLGRLEESFKSQNSFISNASHEIKNPLTMISGTAEIALLKERSVDDYKKTLESILQDSEFLNSLVNQLFLLAKTDTNFEKLPKDKFLLLDLLEIISDQNKKLYPKKLNIIISNLSQGALLFGNKELLISAIQNLLDNAIKFSEGKDVILETKRLEKQIRIRITDNGPGVKEYELIKITSAFYRSETVRNIEGHGIGLALAKKIIELHDGNLGFKNRNISSGLQVEITLPLIN